MIWLWVELGMVLSYLFGLFAQGVRDYVDQQRRLHQDIGALLLRNREAVRAAEEKEKVTVLRFEFSFRALVSSIDGVPQGWYNHELETQ